MPFPRPVDSTRYPPGLVEPIPFRLHLAMDAARAIALAATPFLAGQYEQGRPQWLTLAAFELSSPASTDPRRPAGAVS